MTNDLDSSIYTLMHSLKEGALKTGDVVQVLLGSFGYVTYKALDKKTAHKVYFPTRSAFNAIIHKNIDHINNGSDKHRSVVKFRKELTSLCKKGLEAANDEKDFEGFMETYSRRVKRQIKERGLKWVSKFSDNKSNEVKASDNFSSLYDYMKRGL